MKVTINGPYTLDIDRLNAFLQEQGMSEKRQRKLHIILKKRNLLASLKGSYCDSIGSKIFLYYDKNRKSSWHIRSLNTFLMNQIGYLIASDRYPWMATLVSSAILLLLIVFQLINFLVPVPVHTVILEEATLIGMYILLNFAIVKISRTLDPRRKIAQSYGRYRDLEFLEETHE